MTKNAEIEGNNSKTQDSNINNFLNNIPPNTIQSEIILKIRMAK